MDGMPPLVEQDWQYAPRPDGLPGGWPAPNPWPGTAGGGGAGVGGFAQPAQATTWFSPAPALAPVIVPMYPAAAMPALSAAPNNAAFTPNDGWVHDTMQRPATPYRSLSTRSHTPFDHSPRSDSSYLSRSRSFTNHLSRSRSFNASIQERHKRPPRDWRPKFSMIRPSAFESAIGSLFHVKSLTGVDPGIIPKATLSQYLCYSSTHHPMTLDVRENPDNVSLAGLGRPTDVQWDLMRYACEPPLPVMILGSSYYPWLIEARSSNPTGVTLYDIFLAIWTSMRTQISREDYWNVEMDEVARDRIAQAYNVRCGDDLVERGFGIRRVDYLMGRVMLKGLVRLKEGTFEMKLKYPAP